MAVQYRAAATMELNVEHGVVVMQLGDVAARNSITYPLHVEAPDMNGVRCHGAGAPPGSG